MMTKPDVFVTARRQTYHHGRVIQVVNTDNIHRTSDDKSLCILLAGTCRHSIAVTRSVELTRLSQLSGKVGKTGTLSIKKTMRGEREREREEDHV